MKYSWCMVLVPTLLVCGAAAADVAQVEISEWQVPYEKTRPRDPFVAPDGGVWFCGQTGAYVARFDPESGEFKKYPLADGAGPHNLIVDEKGIVWFAANTKPYIGRLDPADGGVREFPMPDGEARDPHTLVFDGDGDIWFTAQWSNYVGKLDTDTGDVTTIAIPVAKARPYGIKIGPKDRPWIVLFGTNKLATVDPESMTLETFDLPREDSRPRRLEVTADGSVWYGDYRGGMLGRFEPASGDITEWRLPGGEDARPYGMALDDKGVVWLAEGGSPNRLVGFDTAALEIISVNEIPSAQGAVRHMYFHPPTRAVWFGEDSNFIGRARVP